MNKLKDLQTTTIKTIKKKNFFFLAFLINQFHKQK